jgi:beta-N-acetylhexosaminidase
VNRRGPAVSRPSTELDALALRVQLPGFPGTTASGEVLDLFHEGLGGVCLFGSNTAAGSHALTELTAVIETARPKAVVAVDEEGGDVSRLYALEGSPVLGAAALGAADDLALTRATGRAVGTDLAAVGVTLDLAPVADINTNPDNPVIGTRSFGADPERVAAHVAAWVEGLREAGVGACAKHFPGHGDTAQDSHLDLPTVDTALDTLLVRELAPFAAAVGAGADAVMTSHLLVRAVDPDTPATLSHPVLALLRERLGFHGAIVTDALDMVGVSGTRTVAEAAVLALGAGADLLCLGAEKEVALVRDVQAAIAAAVRSGVLAEERLRDAASRVDRLADLPGSPAAVTARDDAAQLAGARRALLVEGPLPDLSGATVAQVTTSASIAVGEVPWGLRPDVVLAPDAAGVAGAGPVVLQVRDVHRHPDVLHLIDRVCAGGRAAVVVDWGWPGPYDGPAPRLCPHGSSRPAIAAVTEVLRTAGWGRP